jgi:hypothetical protein
VRRDRRRQKDQRKTADADSFHRNTSFIAKSRKSLPHPKPLSLTGEGLRIFELSAALSASIANAASLANAVLR